MKKAEPLKRQKQSQFMQGSKSLLGLALILALSALLLHQIHKTKVQQMQLNQQMASLQKTFLSALEEQSDLQAEIASQNDPAWIELMLMKNLGVVPEGQTKVYFEK